jgi:predicted transposase YdaD
MKRELINQVRELLERNLSTAEIAHRTGIDPDLVKMATDLINQLLT